MLALGARPAPGPARAGATTVTLACLAAAPAAAAEAPPSKASCAQAYESAQENRASGRLRETRNRLSYCAQDACPDFVKSDCSRWLEEVERELPSVIVSAPDVAEAEKAAIVVKLDGEVVDEALTGSALSLDPGAHELSLERPGRAPVQRTILAQQGVQDRPVTIHLTSGAADSGPSDSGSLRPLAYAAWGVGAVGLGVFSVLGTLARADKRALQEDCSEGVNLDPSASNPPGVCYAAHWDEREDTYKLEEVLADIGLITGIAGAAAGTAFFILSLGGDSDGPSDVALRVDAGAVPGGGWATVSGSF